MQKQIGEAPKELTEMLSVKCPEMLLHVWEWFSELNKTRTNNGFSENAISYLEIECWARMLQVNMSAYEVRALKAIDDTWMRKTRKKKPAK